MAIVARTLAVSTVATIGGVVLAFTMVGDKHDLTSVALFLSSVCAIIGTIAAAIR